MTQKAQSCVFNSTNELFNRCLRFPDFFSFIRVFWKIHNYQRNVHVFPIDFSNRIIQSLPFPHISIHIPTKYPVYQRWPNFRDEAQVPEDSLNWNSASNCSPSVPEWPSYRCNNLRGSTRTRGNEVGPGVSDIMGVVESFLQPTRFGFF